MGKTLEKLTVYRCDAPGCGALSERRHEHGERSVGDLPAGWVRYRAGYYCPEHAGQAREHDRNRRGWPE